LSLRPRHEYAAALPRGLPCQRLKTNPEVPHPLTDGCAPRPARIHQVRAGQSLRDVTAPVSRVLLSTMLAGPTPSGGAGASRLCRGCFPPSPAPPGSGCPQLHRLAATRRWRRSLTSTRIDNASRRPQAWIESLFGHVKGDWPHLEKITDPGVLEAELDRVRAEYNTVRLHAGIGYVTPDDEHHGRGDGIRQARRDGLSHAREARITYRRTTTEDQR